MQYVGVCMLLAAFGLWMLEFTRHPEALSPAKGSYRHAAYTISPNTAAFLTTISGLFLIAGSITGGA